MSWRCTKCDAYQADLSFEYLVKSECENCAPKDKPMTDQAKPITFEGGKYYHKQIGVRLLCLATGQRYTIFEFNDGDVVTLDKYQLKDYGIIAEWRDVPAVDWSLYAKWHVALAMSEDRNWWIFTVRPVKSDHGWLSQNLGGIEIPKEYAPKFSGRWQDSLVERPA